MTEREKMLAGIIYDSRDEELLNMYHVSKKLLAEFDNTPSTDGKRKFEILTELFGGIGEGVWIEKAFFCDYGKNIFIGKGTFISYNCVFIDDNYMKIGENALIGPAVQIYTATHPVAVKERIITKPDGSTAYTTFTKPVNIGNNVWVGGGTVICPGVSIGNNSVIGAGSVVTKDVPSGCIAYGNPCRVASYIE